MALSVDMKKNNKKIAIIDYKMSNMFSIENALKKLDYESVIVTKPEELINVDGAILPGVGSFPEALNHLYSLNLTESIYDFIKSGKPLMGICLGLQILFSKSYEHKETEGLNIIDGEVVKFDKSNVKSVPHLGWNSLNILNENKINSPYKGINNSSLLYFVHSYYVKPKNKDCIITTTKYGGIEFTSSIIKDNIFATQFHPEKSGVLGLKILDNFFKE